MRRMALIWTLMAAACTARGPRRAARPTEPLALDEARAYVLALVNEDRADRGLPELERDQAAERAGQRHAEDMARRGFTAHWGSDGSVPEERYTEAGGRHFVQENAACFFDGKARPIEEDPRFLPDQLEKVERAFFGETPPHDGHRRNILSHSHTGLGVGLAKPAGIPELCLTQEFVDVRGAYGPLPMMAEVGLEVTVSGEVHEPVEFGGVGVSRVTRATSMRPGVLNATASYPIPEPYAIYFPAGFPTPKPVALDGNSFSIDLTLSDRARPGRYGVSIWGRYPESGRELVMISLRTIDVR